MQDVVDSLREKNIDVPVPLELPTEDDLVVIQEEILIHLPDDYKQFLLMVSDVIYGSIEPATVCDEQSHTYLPDMASRAWDIGIPRELIPVCEVDGNFYCIAEDGEISYWVDLEATEDSWSSIWHWAADIWLNS
ncbi:SMI1/KNR4 family protein [Endozoicomonadaceae bacterium StTr2]